MFVMKIRVSVSSLSKVQLSHPWQVSIFVICKNAYTLFAHPVLCSDLTPRALKKFTFCVITALLWILPLPANWCRRARECFSFSFIRSDGFTLQVYIKHYVKSIVSKGAHKL